MGAKITKIIQKVQWGAQRTVVAAGCMGAGWGAFASSRHPFLWELGASRVVQSYLGKSGRDRHFGCC